MHFHRATPPKQIGLGERQYQRYREEEGKKEEREEQTSIRTSPGSFISDLSRFQEIIQCIFPDPRPVQERLEPPEHIIFPVEPPDSAYREPMAIQELSQTRFRKMMEMKGEIQVEPF